MSKPFVLKLDREGVGELLKSDEVKNVITKHGEKIARRCGEGYECTSKIIISRQVANVHPTTSKATKDNLENNTLLKALR